MDSFMLGKMMGKVCLRVSHTSHTDIPIWQHFSHEEVSISGPQVQKKKHQWKRIKTECLTSSSTGNYPVKLISEKLNNNLLTKRSLTTKMGFNTEKRISQLQAPYKCPGVWSKKRRGKFFLPREISPHPLIVSSHFRSLNNSSLCSMPFILEEPKELYKWLSKLYNNIHPFIPLKAENWLQLAIFPFWFPVFHGYFSRPLLLYLCFALTANLIAWEKRQLFSQGQLHEYNQFWGVKKERKRCFLSLQHKKYPFCFPKRGEGERP